MEGSERHTEEPEADRDFLDPPDADEGPVETVAGAELDAPETAEPSAPSAPPSASWIEEVILEAQQSARQFVDQARQQSSMLIEEADRQAREQRAELIESSRHQVDELAGTVSEMLQSLNQVTARLDEIVNALQSSSDRLRDHVAELLGGVEATDEHEGGDETSASGIRRFTRR